MLLFLYSTIVVEPGCAATITEYGDIKIMVHVCLCHINYMYVLRKENNNFVKAGTIVINLVASMGILLFISLHVKISNIILFASVK